MADKPLSDKLIAIVTGKLSKHAIKRVAVVYMETPHNEVDNAKGNDAAIRRLLFCKWRNRKQATVQVPLEILF